MELTDAVIGLIIAAIVSIVSLTIKSLHGSSCWTRDACCICNGDEKKPHTPPTTPPPSPVLHRKPLNESNI